MRETVVEKYLVQRVRALGGQCFKIMPIPAGVPDRLVILPDRPMLLVELKQPKGKRSKLQIERHNRLEAIGHPVATLWTKQEVDEWLSRQ